MSSSSSTIHPEAGMYPAVEKQSPTFSHLCNSSEIINKVFKANVSCMRAHNAGVYPAVEKQSPTFPHPCNSTEIINKVFKANVSCMRAHNAVCSKNHTARASLLRFSVPVLTAPKATHLLLIVSTIALSFRSLQVFKVKPSLDSPMI